MTSHVIWNESFVMVAHFWLLDVIDEACAAIDEVGEGSNTQDGDDEVLEEVNDEHILESLNVSRK